MATIAVLKKETRENVPTKRKRPEKQVDIIPKAYMDFIYIWLEILMIVPAIVVGKMDGSLWCITRYIDIWGKDF